MGRERWRRDHPNAMKHARTVRNKSSLAQKGFAALAVLCVGCGGSRDVAPPAVPLPVVTAPALRVISATASLDMPLQASAYAWRDLAPDVGTTRVSHDLRVSVQLRGGVVPPKVLLCDGMYLVFRDSVFVAARVEQRPGDGPGAIECLLRGGPAWPIDSTVHIIVRARSGEQRVLIRRETPIDATS